MNGAVGETLAVGVVVIFGIRPVTDSVLALVRELRKQPRSRPKDTAGGAADVAPALSAARPTAPHDGHSVRYDNNGAWVCRCGVPLGATRAHARQAMKNHRTELDVAREASAIRALFNGGAA